jgi:hypothetical protein
MSTSRVKVRCPKCRTILQFDPGGRLERREVELRRREQELQQRDERLRVLEAEHVSTVRLIRNCLHPDRHPEQADRYTRALQAFNAMLEAPRSQSIFDDEIPF